MGQPLYGRNGGFVVTPENWIISMKSLAKIYRLGFGLARRGEIPLKRDGEVHR